MNMVLGKLLCVALLISLVMTYVTSPQQIVFFPSEGCLTANSNDTEQIKNKRKRRNKK